MHAEDVRSIIKTGQGHKSHFAQADIDAFIAWMHSPGYPPKTLVGQPAETVEARESFSKCAQHDREEAEKDLAEPDPDLPESGPPSTNHC